MLFIKLSVFNDFVFVVGNNTFYEIDREITNVGFDFFGLKDNKLNVFIEDARWGIAHNNKIYQVINVDVYNPPYIPWHLTTQEFFLEI